MSATPYYELPIFGAHDPVDLLVTYNTAMGIVDMLANLKVDTHGIVYYIPTV